MIQDLPSPARASLLPLEKDGSGWTLRKMGDDEWQSVWAAVDSGHWEWDPTEIDPRSGMDALATVVHFGKRWSTSRVLDVARRAVSATSGPRRCDLTAAYNWAIHYRYWDIAEGLEALGEIPKAMGARKRQALAGLEWSREEVVAEKIVANLLAPESFGTLDALKDGLPVALRWWESRLAINGPALDHLSNFAEAKQALENFGGLAEAALRRQPTSDFAVWSWLGMGQALRRMEQLNPGSGSRPAGVGCKNKWVALATRIERAHAPGVRAGFTRRQAFDEAVMRTVERGLEGLRAVGNLRLQQRVTAFALVALREWTQCVKPMDGQTLQEARNCAEAVVWSCAARSSAAVDPCLFADSKVSQEWNSALYYALTPGLPNSWRQEPKLESMPAWVVQPWLTLPPVFHSTQASAQPNLNAAVVEILDAHPPGPGQTDALAGMLEPSGNAALGQKVQSLLLSHRLAEDLPRPTLRSRPRL